MSERLTEEVAQALHANYLCSCKEGKHVTTASDLLDARTAIKIIKEATNADEN